MVQVPGQDDAAPRTATPGDGRIAKVPLVGRIGAGTPVIPDQLAEQAGSVAGPRKSRIDG